MNRVISLLLLSMFALVICTRTLSNPPTDEETIKNLETEAAKHAGFSEADVTFTKSIMAAHETFIDPLGHIYDQTPTENEKMTVISRGPTLRMTERS